MVNWWNEDCDALVDFHRRLMARSKENKPEVAGRTYEASRNRIVTNRYGENENNKIRRASNGNNKRTLKKGNIK